MISAAQEQQQPLCVRYTVSATGGVLTRPSWRWVQVRQWHRLPKSLLRSVGHATQRAAATVAVVTLVGAFCVMPAANAQPQATLGAPIVSQTAQPTQQARDIPPAPQIMGGIRPNPQIMGEIMMPEPPPKVTSPQKVKPPSRHKPKTKAITGKVRPPQNPQQPEIMGKPASPPNR